MQYSTVRLVFRSHLGSDLSVCNIGRGRLVGVQLGSTFDRALAFLCRCSWDRGCIISWGILLWGSVSSLAFLRRTYNLLGRPETRGLLDNQCTLVPHHRRLRQSAQCFVLQFSNFIGTNGSRSSWGQGVNGRVHIGPRWIPLDEGELLLVEGLGGVVGWP
jgi:hypothetical protein